MSLPPGLYGIADAGFGNPVVLGRALLAGGVGTLQLRCKGWAPDQVRDAARVLAPACRAQGVPLLLNDHLALAALGNGVHLGQDDGPFRRDELAPGALVGRSTHDQDQLRAAIAEGVDYVGFGPVFATHTKVGARPARGLTQLAQVVAASTVPVVAIGGIDAAALPAVQATGVHAWAVISAILGQPDPAAAARRFL